MAIQQYLKSAGTYIMCVVKMVNNNAKGVVVLIPGFSQSSSDIDYFMTNLANDLNKQGYITVQVDLYGHGDSYGDLSNLRIQTIESNILSVYEFIKTMEKNIPVFAVTRGFYGNILCRNSIASIFTKIISINPLDIKLKLDGHVQISEENEELEIEELLTVNNVFQMLFIALGADNTNIKGQKINNTLLCEILDEIDNLTCPENMTIISSCNDKNEIKIISSLDEITYPIKYLADHCFIRDPDWQVELVDKVVELVEEKRNESAISNK